MNKARMLPILLLLLALPRLGRAQLVNVEKSRFAGQDTTLLNIASSLKIQQNTRFIVESNNNLAASWDRGPHTLLGLYNISLLRVDGAPLVNGGFQHLRYNYTLRDSGAFTLELFVQDQYNTVKLLDRRLLLGFGPRFRLVRRGQNFFYFAPLLMYEREDLSEGVPLVNKVLKLDWYASFGLSLFGKAYFTNITYFQPELADLDDFRVFNENSLAFSLGPELLLAFNFNLSYDAYPPTPDIPRLFHTFFGSLNIVLGL